MSMTNDRKTSHILPPGRNSLLQRIAACNDCGFLFMLNIQICLLRGNLSAEEDSTFVNDMQIPHQFPRSLGALWSKILGNSLWRMLLLKVNMTNTSSPVAVLRLLQLLAAQFHVQIHASMLFN